MGEHGAITLPELVAKFKSWPCVSVRAALVRDGAEESCHVQAMLVDRLVDPIAPVDFVSPYDRVVFIHKITESVLRKSVKLPESPLQRRAKRDLQSNFLWETWTATGSETSFSTHS